MFDRTPDVGGVWSRTRRYPGLTTQSPKAQYSLSDFPMPGDFPEWPTGAQVQAYLAAYADAVRPRPRLRLDTEVTAARPATAPVAVDGARRPPVRRSSTGSSSPTACSASPRVPAYPGLDEFAAAGGRLCAGTEFHDAEDARGKHVLVVGYGKSACDVTVPISEVAASTDVIARQLLWKVPRKIGGVLNFKMLLLTRHGRGAVPLPPAARLREVPARARQRRCAAA